MLLLDCQKPTPPTTLWTSMHKWCTYHPQLQTLQASSFWIWWDNMAHYDCTHGKEIVYPLYKRSATVFLVVFRTRHHYLSMQLLDHDLVMPSIVGSSRVSAFYMFFLQKTWWFLVNGHMCNWNSVLGLFKSKSFIFYFFWHFFFMFCNKYFTVCIVF